MFSLYTTLLTQSVQTAGDYENLFGNLNFLRVLCILARECCIPF
jgi:hypothetical protein